jgi:hypothetical protein
MLPSSTGDQAREDPGRSETMTARIVSREFDTDEEFFRYHLARHGRDRSLFSLWQLLRNDTLPSTRAGTEDL